MDITNMQGVNLQGANMQGVNMQGANMQGANMQGANMLLPGFSGKAECASVQPGLQAVDVEADIQRRGADLHIDHTLFYVGELLKNPSTAITGITELCEKIRILLAYAEKLAAVKGAYVCNQQVTRPPISTPQPVGFNIESYILRTNDPAEVDILNAVRSQITDPNVIAQHRVVMKDLVRRTENLPTYPRELVGEFIRRYHE